MKDTVFISHANPQDNYFASWLGSKLMSLGYKVWVDVRDIKPGQYFNKDFEHVIRNNTAIFLAVVSDAYLSKSTQADTGVMNEILCARTIRGIDNFIVPLRLDDSDYSNFSTGLIGRQAISFNNNWADGLHELIKYLDELSIQKITTPNAILPLWYEAQQIKTLPTDEPEKYYTNWFSCELPSYVYIYKVKVSIGKAYIDMPYTYIKEKDRLISFVAPNTMEQFVQLESVIKVSVSDIATDATQINLEDFELTDPNKKLVRLLNRSFRSHLLRSKMRKFTQANKKEVYFFPFSSDNIKSVSLKSIGKTRRAIIGKTSEFTWYFAISHAAVTKPFTYFKIFYHLVFTDNHGNLLNQDDQHELRRSLPSDWFNRKWLETLLAMMLKVSNFSIDKKIRIEADKDIFIVLDALPIAIMSKKGYREPNSELEA